MSVFWRIVWAVRERRCPVWRADGEHDWEACDYDGKHYRCSACNVPGEAVDV